MNKLQCSPFIPDDGWGSAVVTAYPFSNDLWDYRHASANLDRFYCLDWIAGTVDESLPCVLLWVCFCWVLWTAEMWKSLFLSVHILCSPRGCINKSFVFQELIVNRCQHNQMWSSLWLNILLSERRVCVSVCVCVFVCLCLCVLDGEMHTTNAFFVPTDRVKKWSRYLSEQIWLHSQWSDKSLTHFCALYIWRSCVFESSLVENTCVYITDSYSQCCVFVFILTNRTTRSTSGRGSCGMTTTNKGNKALKVINPLEFSLVKWKKFNSLNKETTGCLRITKKNLRFMYLKLRPYNVLNSIKVFYAGLQYINQGS